MIKMNRLLWLCAIVFVTGFGCTSKFFPASEEKSLGKDVIYLSSSELQGRKAGERGDSLAAVYIRSRFSDLHLKFLCDNGLQYFDLITDAALGKKNHLSYNDHEYIVTSDYLPYSFSSSELKSGEVVFAGYGFDFRTDSLSWNDYDQLDVKGKWVLLMKGDPEPDKSISAFEAYSNERYKVMVAQDHGAAGVLLVAGPKFSEKDQLQGLFFDKNSSRYSIPVFQITRTVANQLLTEAGVNIEQLEETIITSGKAHSVILKGTVKGQADVILEKRKSANVVAMLPGKDPVLKNEYIVIGAHYDHLGMGGPGSGSRQPDTTAVHPGADDNASGVGAILELASMSVREKNNRRSLLFVAFGAEEMGLIGSKTFMGASPIDLKKTVAMLNFDMVGRMDTSLALSIGGTKTALESENLLTQYNRRFKLAFSGEGIGPSDHASFYLQNIPVLFFSTGAHTDYHTPGDTSGKINFAGIREITGYAWKLISEIANRDLPLTFQEAGPRIQRSRGGRFKVTLGIMPDYSGLEKRGLRIDAVTKGKPADKAGMLKGDIITAIDGKTVGNIYDYMNRLTALKEGELISIDILREGKPMVLIVQL